MAEDGPRRRNEPHVGVRAEQASYVEEPVVEKPTTPETKADLKELPLAQRLMVGLYDRVAKGIRGRAEVGEKKLATLTSERTALEAAVQAAKNIVAEMQTGAAQEEDTRIIETIQAKIEGLEKKQEALSVKIEKKGASVDRKRAWAEKFTQKGDMLIEGVIGRYEAKLEPMRENLAELSISSSEADMSLAALEALHRSQKSDLTKREAHKNEYETKLREAGLSAREVANYTKEITQTITEQRKKITKDGADIKKKRASMGGKIAKVVAQAEAYEKKKRNIETIKESRSAPRAEPAETEPTSTKDEAEAAPAEQVQETIVFEETQPTIESYMTAFNAEVEEKDGSEGFVIDIDDFCSVLEKQTFTNVFELELSIEDFQKLITIYSRLVEQRKPAAERKTKAEQETHEEAIAAFCKKIEEKRIEAK